MPLKMLAAVSGQLEWHRGGGWGEKGYILHLRLGSHGRIAFFTHLRVPSRTRRSAEVARSVRHELEAGRGIMAGEVEAAELILDIWDAGVDALFTLDRGVVDAAGHQAASIARVAAWDRLAVRGGREAGAPPVTEASIGLCRSRVERVRRRGRLRNGWSREGACLAVRTHRVPRGAVREPLAEGPIPTGLAIGLFEVGVGRHVH
jgi:hypothetical protein